jgi:hypothetical protein
MISRRLTSVALVVGLAFGGIACGDEAEKARIEAERLAQERHDKEMARLDREFRERQERLDAAIARRAAAKTEEERRKADEEIAALRDAGAAPVRPNTPSTATGAKPACTCVASDPLCGCL